MRHLRRLLVVTAVASIVFLAAAPAPEAQVFYFCYDSGNCRICCDDFTGCCTAACEPGGDSWWC